MGAIIIVGVFIAALIVGMVLGNAARGSDDEGESNELRV